MSDKKKGAFMWVSIVIWCAVMTGLFFKKSKDDCDCIQYHHYTKTTIEGCDFKIELDSICAVEKQGNKIISHHLKN